MEVIKLITRAHSPRKCLAFEVERRCSSACFPGELNYNLITSSGFLCFLKASFEFSKVNGDIFIRILIIIKLLGFVLMSWQS
jgi:hypothetical protein